MVPGLAYPENASVLTAWRNPLLNHALTQSRNGQKLISFWPAYLHCNPFWYTCTNHIANCCSSEIME